MTQPLYTKMGATRTRAHQMTGAGLKFHAYTPLALARPTLENVEYRAAPVPEEGVTLYSFASLDDMKEFLAAYGSQGAVAF